MLGLTEDSRTTDCVMLWYQNRVFLPRLKFADKIFWKPEPDSIIIV